MTTTMTTQSIRTVAEAPELASAIDALIERVWAPFMLQDPIAVRYLPRIYAAFPAYQFALVDATGVVIAAGNSVPLAWHKPLDQLPDNGWDWALPQAFADREVRVTPNTLVGLMVTIDPAHQGQGISATMLKTMKAIGATLGIEQVVIPVRPNHKPRYPLINMEDYARWSTAEQLPFDPWLRTHQRLGAQLIKVCHASQRVFGTVREWETWTGMRFLTSGIYVVPGALVPVEIDLAHDTGAYVEPNVWMHHPMDATTAYRASA